MEQPQITRVDLESTITAPELAALLDVTPARIRQMRASGDLPEGQAHGTTVSWRVGQLFADTAGTPIARRLGAPALAGQAQAREHLRWEGVRVVDHQGQPTHGENGWAVHLLSVGSWQESGRMFGLVTALPGTSTPVPEPKAIAQLVVDLSHPPFETSALTLLAFTGYFGIGGPETVAIDANHSHGDVELVEYKPWWRRDLDTFATVDLPYFDFELRSREIVTAWRPGDSQLQIEPSGPVFDAIKRLTREADDTALPLLQQLRSHLVQDIRDAQSMVLDLAGDPDDNGRGWYVPAVTIPEPPITLDDETISAGVASLVTGRSGDINDVLAVLADLPSQWRPWGMLAELSLDSPAVQRWWDQAAAAPNESPVQFADLQRATGTPLDKPSERLDRTGQLLITDGKDLRTFLPNRGSLETITTAHLVRSQRGGGELLLHGLLNGEPTWQLAAHRNYLAWGYHGGSVTELAALICTLRDHGPRADTSRLNYQHPDITTTRDRLAHLDPDHDHDLSWPW